MSLYLAIVSEVAKAIEMGHDINGYKIIDYGEYTPLGYAIRSNYFYIFKYLLRRKADINLSVDKSRDISPLWYSVERDKYDFVTLLLEHGAKKTCNKEGYSLLTYSILYQDLKLFKCLVTSNVDVNEVDDKGRAPLISAVKVVDIEMTKTLLDYGAEFSIQPALIEAINIDQLKIVDLLIEKGADVNFQSVTGFTPLTKATNTGNLEITELLIKKGADVNLLDCRGNSPLVNSVRHGQLDLVQLLVENGANAQQADRHGNLLITEALNTKSAPVIKFLLENKAKLDNIRDKDGYSPLTLSIQERNFDMLKFFLDRKVDVNEPDNNHKMPLSLAVESGNVRFAKMLTEHGASVDDVIETIRQLATTNDNWKKFFEELQAERRILKEFIPSNNQHK